MPIYAHMCHPKGVTKLIQALIVLQDRTIAYHDNRQPTQMNFFSF